MTEISETLLHISKLFLNGVFIHNFVLVQFLGLCPFLGVSSKLETAFGMAMATTFVLTLASTFSYIFWAYLLVPLHLEYLKTISFILLIAVLVQLVEIYIKNSMPLMYRVLGVFLPLITSNCAVLGVALLNSNRVNTDLLSSTVYGFSAAVGFSLVLILFAAIRERIHLADVPSPFKGTPISLITAGLMSIAFMGFSGLVKT